MIENWKDINGYKGMYQVSDLGHFRSLDCERTMKNGVVRTYVGQELKPSVSSDGYLIIDLTDLNGVRHTYKAHRLVAEAFVPNPMNKPIVNHRNEYKRDNRASNLEWLTNRENLIYGRTQKRRVEKIGWAIAIVGSDGVVKRTFDSMREASRVLNIPMSGIYNCCKSGQGEYKGYMFKKIYGKKKV